MAVDPDKPFNREEMYLAKAAGEGTTVPDEPWSRKEAYLDKISGRLDGIDEKIAALSTDISLKGSVATETDLPSGAAVGDAYITEDTGVMYVWVGDEWVALGGTGINVVQTVGTSETDVMSQNATTSLVYYDPSTREVIKMGYYASTGGRKAIGIGTYSVSSGNMSLAIGSANQGLNDNTKTKATGQQAIAIGPAAQSSVTEGIAIGAYARANEGSGSVALGTYSSTTQTGEVNIGTSLTMFGYNSTNYRLLTGVHDPQSAHDAATKGYVDGLIIKNAGAPTTSTIGAVGMLLEDTTNGKLYQCTAVSGSTYTWAEVGAGGGSGPTVVQTVGTSTTDVMSQDAVSKLIYVNPSTRYRIAIGNNASAGFTDADCGVSIGLNANAQHKGSVALGYGASTSKDGQVTIKSSSASYGHNNTVYRLLSGVATPEDDHDAATKGYVDAHAGGGGAAFYCQEDFFNPTGDPASLYKDSGFTQEADVTDFYNALVSGSPVVIYCLWPSATCSCITLSGADFPPSMSQANLDNYPISARYTDGLGTGDITLMSMSDPITPTSTGVFMFSYSSNF